MGRALGMGGRSSGAPVNPLLAGLIAYWKLDEASGARNDSFSTNHLTDNNTVAQAGGKVGNSALFVAANTEFLSIVDNIALSVAPGVSFTITFWVWRDVIGVTQGCICKGTSVAAASLEYDAHFTSGNRLQFAASDGTTVATAVNTVDLLSAVDTWYHCAVGYDAVSGNLFAIVNGGAAATAPLPLGVRDGAGAFVIGRRANAASYIDGQVDEVKFWKRALSAAEIAADYAAGLAGTPLL